MNRKGTYETVEITGLYWHFVDLVWVFIFASFICGRGAHEQSHGNRRRPGAWRKASNIPVAIYLWIWRCCCVQHLLLPRDYFHLQGYLRWSLIIIFMLVKAGLIVAIFMHMAWERLALKFAILIPPLVRWS